MMELAKRPYADRLRECEEKLARHYKEMDGLLAQRAPPGEVARVTKGIVAEVKCEAGIARELAADPAYKDRAAGFNSAAGDLDVSVRAALHHSLNRARLMRRPLPPPPKAFARATATLPRAARSRRCKRPPSHS